MLGLMKKQNVKSAEDIAQRDDFRSRVAEKAYLKSEAEGFPLGRELMHWLEAEQEVLKEFAADISAAVVKAVRGTAKKSQARAEPVKPPHTQSVRTQKASAAAAKAKPSKKKKS
jgi:hypothetical protein